MFEMTGGGLQEVAEPVRRCSCRSAIWARPAPHGVRRHRGDAAAAGRNAGAGRPDHARHTPPRRGGLGPEPPRHGARRAGGPLRRAAVGPRARLSQRQPAACASRNRPRTLLASCNAFGLLARQCPVAGGCGLFRRNLAVRHGAAGAAGRGPSEGRRQQLGFARAFVPDTAKQRGRRCLRWRSPRSAR